MRDLAVSSLLSWRSLRNSSISLYSMQRRKCAWHSTCMLCFSSAWCSRYTGLFEMIVRVLTTCHTQHTWDRSICIFLCNRTTLQVLVTYVIGAVYVHPLWFYKHQHDNRVRADMLQTVWNELDYHVDVCRITKGAHVEHLWGMQQKLGVFY
jgi:hypothetical protein